MTWDIVAGIVLLAGFIITIVKTIIPLTNALTRLTERIDSLAELVVKYIDTMEKAGGSLLDKAGAYNPLLAVFTAGAKEWVDDNGTQAAKTYVEYKGMLYYVATATQRFEQYNPETATNNYWVIPRPVAGVFPYLMGMMVIKDMVVQDPNGKKYKCILPSGEYKLVNPPSEAVGIFQLQE